MLCLLLTLSTALLISSAHVQNSRDQIRPVSRRMLQASQEPIPETTEEIIDTTTESSERGVQQSNKSGFNFTKPEVKFGLVAFCFFCIAASGYYQWKKKAIYYMIDDEF